MEFLGSGCELRSICNTKENSHSSIDNPSCQILVGFVKVLHVVIKDLEVDGT